MNEFVTVLDRAAEQGGLITTAQAQRIGMSRLQMSRLEKSGSLERVSQGVYRTAGSAPHEHEQILAAWMALERAVFLSERAASPLDGLVVGGASAAALHGIGDLYVDDVELLVSGPRPRRTTREGIRVRTRTVDREDVVLVHGLPTLSVTATLSDLAQQRVPLDHVANALRDGEDRVDVARLDVLLDPLAARNGFDDGATFRVRLYELARRDPESVAADAAKSPLAPLIVFDFLKSLDLASLEALRPSMAIGSSPLLAHLQSLVTPITTSWLNGVNTNRLFESVLSHSLVPRLEGAIATQMGPMLAQMASLDADEVGKLAAPVQTAIGSDPDLTAEPDDSRSGGTE